MSIYDSIIDITDCHECCEDFIVLEGKLKRNTNKFSEGDKVILSFYPNSGLWNITDKETGEELERGTYSINMTFK